MSEPAERAKREEEDPFLDLSETVDKVKEELEQEQKRMEKAKKKEYEYKAIYGDLFYTDIPKNAPIHLKGAELTAQSLDKIGMLLKVFPDLSNNDDLLGELQFAFISFFLG